MRSDFDCDKCGERRPAALYASGKRKITCKVCDSYRKQFKKPNAIELFGRFEVLYLHRWHNASMVERGMYRCVDCCAVCDKSQDDFSKNSNRCYSCFRSNANRYKKSKRTANAPSRHEVALAEAKKSSELSERNAFQAFEHYLKERATDSWVGAYYEGIGEPWRNPRLTEVEQYRTRYREDREFALKERMRRQIRKAQRKDGIADVIRGAINRGGSSNKVESTLGYSISDLKAHIEKQFTKGMSWDAFKDGQIHIDHIVPQACFDLTDHGEWMECWSLSNLRPCWAGENLSKSAKRLHLL